MWKMHASSGLCTCFAYFSLLRETRTRLRLMLSSPPSRFDLFWIPRKPLELATSKFNKQRSLRYSSCFDWKWRHHLLPIGSTSHKPVNFVSCWGCDFSIAVQTISKGSTVLERAIQVGKFLVCKPLDTFARWPRKRDSSGPAVVCALHKWLFSRLSHTYE